MVLQPPDKVRSFIEFTLLLLLIFVITFENTIHFNEMDVIPFSKAVADNTWLTTDWYLHLDIQYRYLFSYITGIVISKFGYATTIILGRLLTFSLFAFAFNQLRKSLSIGFYTSFFALTLFLATFRQTVSHGEWMIGGFETKAFAYACVVIAMTAAIKRNTARMLLFLGLSLSFHLLIGIYGSVCTVFAFLMIGGNFKTQISDLLKKSWLYLLFGLNGLVAIFSYLQQGLDESVKSNGWEIYVNYRVSSHVIPHLDFKTIAIFVLALAASIWLMVKDRSPLKWIGYFIFAALGFWCLGWMIYATGSTDLLRFYWFRFGDTMIPFLGSIAIFTMLSRVKVPIEKIKSIYSASRSNVLFYLIPFAIIGMLFLKSSINSIPQDHTFIPVVDEQMTNWIKKNTPQDAVFSVPIHFFNFYLNADRSMFVSYKHCPQKAEDIENWHNRILSLNKNLPIQSSGFISVEEVYKNYNKLSAEEIIEISGMYNVDYFMFRGARSPLPFEVVHKTRKYILYKVKG